MADEPENHEANMQELAVQMVALFDAMITTNKLIAKVADGCRQLAHDLGETRERLERVERAQSPRSVRGYDA